MKKAFLALGLTLSLLSCNSNGNQRQNDNYGEVIVNEPNVVVTPASNLGDALDLQALGELVKTSKNAQDIEDKLNASGSINNLDLDGNGSVDYIRVVEYGEGNTKGFSFVVDLANDEKQEVATVAIEKGSNNANMNIQGNQQLYGHSANYHSSYSLSDLLVMNYLFSYHRPYYSPYHYGYYPTYYRSYRSAPMSSYRSRMSTTTRTSTFTRSARSNSSIKSPNASSNAKSVTTRAKSMASPTKSQKSFSRTNSSNSRPKTSGFGSSSRNSSKSSNSYSSGSSRRSSGFGSSSRSSSRRR